LMKKGKSHTKNSANVTVSSIKNVKGRAKSYEGQGNWNASPGSPIKIEAREEYCRDIKYKSNNNIKINRERGNLCDGAMKNKPRGSPECSPGSQSEAEKAGYK
jgi:hypothetical protein